MSLNDLLFRARSFSTDWSGSKVKSKQLLLVPLFNSGCNSFISFPGGSCHHRSVRISQWESEMKRGQEVRERGERKVRARTKQLRCTGLMDEAARIVHV